MHTLLLAVTLAAMLWFALPGVAHAGFLVPLIAGAAFAATTAGILIGAGLNIALAVGVSFVASKLLAKSADPVQDVAGGVELDLRVDADVPQSLIVGRAVTGGSLGYAETFGKRGTVDNSDMIQIIPLADHPVTGLVQLLADAQDAPLAPAIPPELAQSWGLNAVARGMIVGGFDAKVAVQFYDGTQTAADELTVTALADHPERPWTSAMFGRGRAYLRVHSIYDKDKVSGPMQWRAVLDGIRLYDPRQDSSVGGSGAHRFDNLDTHEFTRNLAVICYNILRGIRVKDHTGAARHFYGLENTSVASCPLDSWFAAMNEEFHGGAEISLATEPLEALRQIIMSCDGRLSEVGGVYKLRLGAPGLPVISFDDGALRADEGDQFKSILPQERRVNYVTGKFTSPDDGWLPKVAPPRTDAAMEEADGRRLSADLDLPWVQSAAHMQRLQQQMLKRSRRERSHVVPFPPAAFGLEPGDTVEWTSERNGYSEKLFEVEEPVWHTNLDSTVAIIEIDPTDYDWNAETDFIAQPVGSLITDRPAPKIIEGFDAEGFVHQGANGIARPAIRVTWDVPDDGDLTRVEVQVRRSALIAEAISAATDEPAAAEMIILASLAPATSYEVRGRFLSFNGYPTDWSLWEPVTTPDVRIIQAELSAALDAKVRAADELLTERLAEARAEVELLATALNLHVSALRRMDGESLVALGKRHGEAKASINQVAVLVANAQEFYRRADHDAGDRVSDEFGHDFDGRDREGGSDHDCAVER